MFKTASVSCDWSDEVFECYSDGSRWNGWACPFFTFENAKKVAKASGDMSYLEDRDVFLWTDVGSGEEEIIEPKEIEVDGVKVKTYPIGAWSWCWYMEDKE